MPVHRKSLKRVSKQLKTNKRTRKNKNVGNIRGGSAEFRNHAAMLRESLVKGRVGEEWRQRGRKTYEEMYGAQAPHEEVSPSNASAFRIGYVPPTPVSVPAPPPAHAHASVPGLKLGTGNYAGMANPAKPAKPAKPGFFRGLASKAAHFFPKPPKVQVSVV